MESFEQKILKALDETNIDLNINMPVLSNEYRITLPWVTRLLSLLSIAVYVTDWFSWVQKDSGIIKDAFII